MSGDREDLRKRIVDALKKCSVHDREKQAPVGLSPEWIVEIATELTAGLPELASATTTEGGVEVDPTLHDSIEQIIINATCTEFCDSTEEECRAENIQPVVWRNGRLAAVDADMDVLVKVIAEGIALSSGDILRAAAFNMVAVMLERRATQVTFAAVENEGKETPLSLELRDIAGEMRATSARVSVERSIVAHLRPEAALLYCVECCYGGSIFVPVMQGDLADGSVCNTCGRDLLEVREGRC